jgi:hypothetical protein
MKSNEQVAFKHNGRAGRKAIYRPRMVNGEWAPHWHRCTVADAEAKLRNGAEKHPNSL